MFSSLSFPSWIRAQITGHNGSVGVHFRSSILSFKAWLWDGHQREKICPNVDRSLTSGKLSPGKQEQINRSLCNTRFPKVSRTQGHKVTFSHSSPRTLSILLSLSVSNSWHSPVDFTPLFPPHLTRWNVFLRIFKKYLFIWLHQVLVAVHRIFSYCKKTLSHSIWDPVPWPGIEPSPPALGAWTES